MMLFSLNKFNLSKALFGVRVLISLGVFEKKPFRFFYHEICAKYGRVRVLVVISRGLTMSQIHSSSIAVFLVRCHKGA